MLIDGGANCGLAGEDMVLLERAEQPMIIHRSVVRPLDLNNPNYRSSNPFGESADIKREPPDGTGDKGMIYSILPDMIEKEKLKLPTVDPETIIGKTFLLDRNSSGNVIRAEVIDRIEAMDGTADQFVVRLGQQCRPLPQSCQ